MNPKQYTFADIKVLQERQQAAHRGRSIYSDMRSISEDQFRNALENQALPIIDQLLEVVRKQHEALETFVERCGYNGDYPLATEAAREVIALAEPFIEKDKHQSRLNERRKEGEERSR